MTVVYGETKNTDENYKKNTNKKKKSVFFCRLNTVVFRKILIEIDDSVHFRPFLLQPPRANMGGYGKHKNF